MPWMFANGSVLKVAPGPCCANNIVGLRAITSLRLHEQCLVKKLSRDGQFYRTVPYGDLVGLSGCQLPRNICVGNYGSHTALSKIIQATNGKIKDAIADMCVNLPVGFLSNSYQEGQCFHYMCQAKSHPPETILGPCAHRARSICLPLGRCWRPEPWRDQPSAQM